MTKSMNILELNRRTRRVNQLLHTDYKPGELFEIQISLLLDDVLPKLEVLEVLCQDDNESIEEACRRIIDNEKRFQELKQLLNLTEVTEIE